MSQTLDLTRDYSHFVLTFFEVISTSAQHIYISALPLSPQASFIHRLYKQYACPSMRIVWGLPKFWDPVPLTAYRDNFHGEVVWSPCSRFIAIMTHSAIEILDAVTLQQINTFESEHCSVHHRLGFSPDGHTFFLLGLGEFTRWDLQTGIPVGTVFDHGTLDVWFGGPMSYVCSLDGTTLAVSAHISNNISIYDLDSGAHTCSYNPSEGWIVAPIWIDGECLHFVTVKPRFIEMWEVPLILVHTPEMLVSFPLPEDITDLEDAIFLFLPALSLLAFTVSNTIAVWDCYSSKFLLKSQAHLSPAFIWSNGMSFSSNGHFFSYRTCDGEVYVWKRSLTSYILHQRLVLHPELKEPLLSPNGEFIVDVCHPMIRLWHTRDQILSPSDIPVPGCGQRSILGFSPNGILAAFAHHRRDTVTILNLQSGDLQLMIDAGMEIECLRVTDSAIMVSGEGKIATWNLPTGNYINARVNVNNSIQTTKLNCLHPTSHFIFPDLSCIVIVEKRGYCNHLQIHDTSTGRQLADIKEYSPQFIALDKGEMWCAKWEESVEGWKIIEDCKSGTAKLEPLEVTACPPQVFQWQSWCGYEVTEDGWVLNSTQKRLLWLPHHWRSKEEFRAWSKQFLCLGHMELPETVILEFLE